MGIRFNALTGQLDLIGTSTIGAATSAPKLLALFDCDIGVAVGDFVIVNGSNSVTNILDNISTTIPHGVFGVAYTKPSTTTVEVMFNGIVGGFSGFTVGDALYVSTLGAPTHTAPATGVVQQVGFAVSSTEFFVQLQQPMVRA